MVSAQAQLQRQAPAQALSALAQLLRRAASPTARHATSDDRFCFAEPDGSDGAGVSSSRPSNAPRRANKYAPNQNADALRSCSCRTLKLPMVWPPSTHTQQLPRRASGRPVLNLDKIPPAQISITSQTQKPENCKLFLILKDNICVLIWVLLTLFGASAPHGTPIFAEILDRFGHNRAR